MHMLPELRWPVTKPTLVRTTWKFLTRPAGAPLKNLPVDPCPFDCYVSRRNETFGQCTRCRSRSRSRLTRPERHCPTLAGRPQFQNGTRVFDFAGGFVARKTKRTSESRNQNYATYY